MKPSNCYNAAILLLLAVWVLPVGYFGIANSAPFWLPRFLCRWADVSRLFSHEQQLWAVYEAHILYEESTDYVPLRDEELFDKQPYGYRSRFQRAFDRSTPERLTALAQWIHLQLKHTNPTRPIAAIRFIKFPANIDDGATPMGRYHQPTSAASLPGEIQIVSEHIFSSTNEGQVHRFSSLRSLE